MATLAELRPGTRVIVVRPAEDDVFDGDEGTVLPLPDGYRWRVAVDLDWTGGPIGFDPDELEVIEDDGTRPDDVIYFVPAEAAR